MPEDNREYWRQKISRDRATAKALKASGWRVLCIWGYALRRPAAVLSRITSELSRAAKECNNTAGRK
jgi:G:T-mismatch repair DNA endonuclease (very short patch repair protein)